MQSVDSFLEHHVEKLIAGQQVPIDLLAVARQVHAVVEEREMIPEAAMTPDGEGFRIHLQSNFSLLPGARTRQRFSLAHEIAHTLFFELRDGLLKARRDAPTGERLEGACHKGAALLLVPTNFLRKELRSHANATDAAYILRLARQFDVSPEVMMRRLSDLDAFDGQFAPVLARRDHSSNYTIEFAVYPPWLKALLPTPRRGIDFGTWFGRTNGQHSTVDGDEASAEMLVKETPQGTLVAKPVDITPTLRIFELRLQT